jgi:hypothetical protein
MRPLLLRGPAPYFGPSNGYEPALPENWISSGGADMWMIWAANFAGCAHSLDCSGAYGLNYVGSS